MWRVYMEKATKKQYEKILRRCKNALTKVENAGATIQNEPEEFQETLYALALNNLRFMLDVSFGSDREADYGFELAEIEKYIGDID
tara:strand:+ start:3377 stop:3634 length:258 start_codon:yes stop_codon:yes gene_type:complete